MGASSPVRFIYGFLPSFDTSNFTQFALTDLPQLLSPFSAFQFKHVVTIRNQYHLEINYAIINMNFVMTC